MNVKTLSILAGLVATLGSSSVLAADSYVTNLNMPSPIVASAPRVAVHVVTVDEYQNNQNQAAAVTSGLQRAQVRAEALAARKLGLISEGEFQAAAPTAAQAELVRLAGLNAVSHQIASK